MGRRRSRASAVLLKRRGTDLSFLAATVAGPFTPLRLVQPAMGSRSKPVEAPFLAESLPLGARCSVPAQLVGIGLPDLDAILGGPQAGQVAVEESVVVVV